MLESVASPGRNMSEAPARNRDTEFSTSELMDIEKFEELVSLVFGLPVKFMGKSLHEDVSNCILFRVARRTDPGARQTRLTPSL